MFSSISEIMTAHTGHWFDASTLRFFSSRISQRVYPAPGGAYFVSSEASPGEGRRYSVRFADSSGDITTVGEFQEYTYRSTAHAAAARFARS